MASLVRRTEICTSAPILSSLSSNGCAVGLGELRVFEADAAQGAEENVGEGGKPQPQLIGVSDLHLIAFVCIMLKNVAKLAASP